jgi:hypothetical protein
MGVDGSAISSSEVVVCQFLASWNEPAEVHAEVRTCIDQELPFTGSIHNEEAAGCRTADMCRR